MKKSAEKGLIVDPFADIRERAAARKAEDERKFPSLPKPRPTKNQRKRARQKANGKRRKRTVRVREVRMTRGEILAAIESHERRLSELLQYEQGLDYPGGQRMLEMDRDYHSDAIDSYRSLLEEQVQAD